MGGKVEGDWICVWGGEGGGEVGEMREVVEDGEVVGGDGNEDEDDIC